MSESFYSEKPLKSHSKNIKILICIMVILLAGFQILIKYFESASSDKKTYTDSYKTTPVPVRTSPDGYKKANYKTVYSCNTPSQKPDINDLSLQSAAEVAAQEVFRLSGQSLNNQVFQMSYYPQKSNGMSGSVWKIDIAVNPACFYSVSIDAHTGKLLNICLYGSPDLKGDYNINSDKNLELISQNLERLAVKAQGHTDEMCNRVQKLLEKKGYLTGPVVSFNYIGTNCDAFAVPSYDFAATIISGKTYWYSVSEDLTQIRTCIFNDFE